MYSIKLQLRDTGSLFAYVAMLSTLVVKPFTRERIGLGAKTITFLRHYDTPQKAGNMTTALRW